eukprot:gene18787-24554_t
MSIESKYPDIDDLELSYEIGEHIQAPYPGADQNNQIVVDHRLGLIQQENLDWDPFLEPLKGQENKKIAILHQPSILTNVTMRDYQIYGLSWLVDRYDKAIHCILADEMGLGKTLQTIAFLAYLKENRRLHGPHLVVVPLSVIFNWNLFINYSRMR